MYRIIHVKWMFIASLALFTSCEKVPDELDMIGSWKLELVTQKVSATRVNNIITGYEPGEFQFNGDHTVVYKQGNRQLNGYFRVTSDNSGYTDDNGVWQQTGQNCFQITLYDTGGNRVANWEFPEFVLSSDRAFMYAYYRDNTGEFCYHFKRL